MCLGLDPVTCMAGSGSGYMRVWIQAWSPACWDSVFFTFVPYGLDLVYRVTGSGFSYLHAWIRSPACLDPGPPQWYLSFNCAPVQLSRMDSVQLNYSDWYNIFHKRRENILEESIYL